jgi:hypothetical protein
LSSRKSRIALGAFCLASAGLYGYAGWIEPQWIEVTRHRVGTSALSRPITIAHLSDVHTRGLGRRERRTLASLERERPDAVVISGDTISQWGDRAMTRAFLSRLRAPLGVWAVRGNWENWHPEPGERAFYESAGVRLLVNEVKRVSDRLWLAGLDDPWSGRADLEAALTGIEPGAEVILLFHSPFYFDRVAGRVPLALSGHTHGGQVRLPLWGPLWLPRGCGRFLEGWYDADGSRMYVSRGIGTSVLDLRFLARPEIALITLEPRVQSERH